MKGEWSRQQTPEHARGVTSVTHEDQEGTDRHSRQGTHRQIRRDTHTWPDVEGCLNALKLKDLKHNETVDARLLSVVLAETEMSYGTGDPDKDVGTHAPGTRPGPTFPQARILDVRFESAALCKNLPNTYPPPTAKMKDYLNTVRSLKRMS